MTVWSLGRLLKAWQTFRMRTETTGPVQFHEVSLCTGHCGPSPYVDRPMPRPDTKPKLVSGASWQELVP